MAEWPNAVVLKTTEPKGSGGSNPSLSATSRRSRRRGGKRAEMRTTGFDGAKRRWGIRRMIARRLQDEVAKEAARITRCIFNSSKTNFDPGYGIGSLLAGGGSRFVRCQRDRRWCGRLLRYGRKHGQRVRVAPSLVGVDHLVPC